MLPFASFALTNPTFENKHSDVSVFKHYDKVAEDLSSCLRQICGFVKNSFTRINNYGFKASVAGVREKLVMHTESKSTFSIHILQSADKSDIFDPRTKLDAGTVMGAFDTFVSYCDDSDLQSLADFYRIFLLSLTAGFIYGGITHTGKNIKIQIGKYDHSSKPIFVVVELTLA